MSHTNLHKPDHVKYPGYVKIIEQAHGICLLYKNHPAFTDLIRKYHYTWNGIWCRRLSISTGAFSDRAAEIGHALLTAGFAIWLENDDVLEKAIHGNFTPEHTRWIYAHTNASLLAIHWLDQDEELYQAAHMIQGAKWDGKSVLADRKHYLQIEAFADRYHFRFTPSAEEKLRKYKEEIEGSEKERTPYDLRLLQNLDTKTEH